MPPSLQELLHGWKRGSTLDALSVSDSTDDNFSHFPSQRYDFQSDPVVFTSSKLCPDFSKNNEHIMHSEARINIAAKNDWAA